MQHIIKRLKEDSDYQGFFLKTLHDFNKKFGTSGIADMNDGQKKEFFDYIDKNYKGKTESINEAKRVTGNISVMFTADVPMEDMENIKTHLASYLETLLKRDKKYKFSVAKGIGGTPAIKID